MVDLVVIALLAIGFGFIVWANDKRHNKYGLFLPACVSVTAAVLTWIITIAAGLGYAPGLTWIPWVASLIVGPAAAVAAVLPLGRSRAHLDNAKLTAALRR